MRVASRFVCGRATPGPRKLQGGQRGEAGPLRAAIGSAGSGSQGQFLAGWFKDTLPDAPLDRIAVLRLDGALYESTIQALDALYPRLSPGGFCIIDDYHAIKACR